MPDKPYFIYSLNMGRSGSASLATTLNHNHAKALVVHELTAIEHHGILTPDVGQLRRFNAFGLNDEIHKFWAGRTRILENHLQRAGQGLHIETAHMLAKGGLVDWVTQPSEPLKDRVAFIHLDRNEVSLARSFIERTDLRDECNRYLYYLDPKYKRNMVKPDVYLEHGYFGLVCWYVREMKTRMRVWQAMLASKKIPVLSISLEATDKDQKLDNFIRNLGFDAYYQKPIAFAHANENVLPAGMTKEKHQEQRKLIENNCRAILGSISPKTHERVPPLTQ